MLQFAEVFPEKKRQIVQEAYDRLKKSEKKITMVALAEEAGMSLWEVRDHTFLHDRPDPSVEILKRLDGTTRLATIARDMRLTRQAVWHRVTELRKEGKVKKVKNNNYIKVEQI